MACAPCLYTLGSVWPNFSSCIDREPLQGRLKGLGRTSVVRCRHKIDKIPRRANATSMKWTHSLTEEDLTQLNRESIENEIPVC